MSDQDQLIRISEILHAKKIDALNAEQCAFLFVYDFEGEVNNGGLNQFFFNGTGDRTHETLAALQEIGAKKTAERLKAAMGDWPDSIVPTAQVERQELLSEIDPNADKWEELDRQICSYENEDISAILLSYLQRRTKQIVG